MRIVCFILSIFLSFSSANDFMISGHSKIMSNFDIDLNGSNIILMHNIKQSITQKDINDIGKIVNLNQSNANLILNELKQSNAPEFLLYLAIVESELKNKVVSGAKATGIWQFMKPTAKTFGLTVNSQIDERKDPVASTEAAIKYMNYLKNMFGKWYLALMAYNCGEGCMQKAINSLKNDDLHTLMSSNAIPKETKNFISKILKISYIATKSDLDKMITDHPIQITKIDVKPGTKLVDVSKTIGIKYDKLVELNPHILNNHSVANRHIYIPLQTNHEELKDSEKLISWLSNRLNLEFLKAMHNIKSDKITLNKQLSKIAME